MFRSSFSLPKYQDSPSLSEQLLLPNLANGPDAFIVTSYVPSYVQRLVSDLAASVEIEPGHLSLTFYIPGDLMTEKNAILRLLDHLSNDFDSHGHLGFFIDDVLQLMGEGGLSFNVLHGKVSSKLAKGTIGVIVERESSDYVTFEDSKPGDYNSPVVPKRSWLGEEISSAEKLLKLINSALDANKPASALVTSERTGKWLVALSDYIQAESSSRGRDHDGGSFAGSASGGDHHTSHLELDDLLEQFGEDEFGLDQAEDDPFYEVFSAGFSIEVTDKDVDGHHVAPVPQALEAWIGEATAICVCGRKFNRIEGCPEVVW